MNASDDMLFALDRDVAIITLNQPDRLNALTLTMLEQLPGLIDRAVAAGARTILLTGAGRAFCAGASLTGGNESATGDLGALVETHYNPAARSLADCPVPIVTAVNGPAVGAGAALALWGDIVVAAESAYFQLSFAGIGLIPDTGCTWLAATSLGRARTLELTLLGEKLPAGEAKAAGLVARVVPDADLAVTAQQLAARLAAGPTLAMKLIRRQVRAALEAGLDASLDQERDHQRIAGRSRDFVEGVTAFREKRPPRFTGR